MAAVEYLCSTNTHQSLRTNAPSETAHEPNKIGERFLNKSNVSTTRYTYATTTNDNETKGTMETTTYRYGLTVESDSMSGVVKQHGKVIKRFRGETAWSNAERYAYDIQVKLDNLN